jgi:hypothetical protein
MHKNATKCNETLSKWCKNKHGASKIIDTFETYQRHTLEDRTWGLRPHTGVDDEADVADLKVVEELDAMTLAPQVQHLRVLEHIR